MFSANLAAFIWIITIILVKCKWLKKKYFTCLAVKSLCLDQRIPKGYQKGFRYKGNVSQYWSDVLSSPQYIIFRNLRIIIIIINYNFCFTECNIDAINSSAIFLFSYLKMWLKLPKENIKNKTQIILKQEIY